MLRTSAWLPAIPLLLLAGWTALCFQRVESAIPSGSAYPATRPSDRRSGEQLYWSERHNSLISKVATPASVMLGLSFLVGWERRWLTLAQKRFILAFWVVGPAVYFFMEYKTFYDRLHEDSLEHLRQFIDLARNIWIACVAVLTALYTGKIPGAG